MKKLTFEEVLKEELKKPNFKKEYDNLEQKYAFINATIEAKLSKSELPDYMKFGDEFPDGRLVAEPDYDNYKSYRIRDALMKVRKLGRPLTDEEMKEFEN